MRESGRAGLGTDRGLPALRPALCRDSDAPCAEAGGLVPARGAAADSSAGFNADVPAAIAKNRVQPQKEIVAVTVGDKVNHTSFGNGTVLALEGAGDKTVAKVKFDVGEKRLLLRYAPLTKLDA